MAVQYGAIDYFYVRAVDIDHRDIVIAVIWGLSGVIVVAIV